MRGLELRRSKRGSVYAVLSFVVITGLLAACIATIAPPAALIVAGTGSAYTPVMALAADGTKHIAWQECPPSEGCAIQYYRTKLGEPLVTHTFPPDVNSNNLTPDIALDADGKAYIVWTAVYSFTPNSNHDVYAVISADGSVSISNLDPNIGGLLPDVSAGGPRVAARGNNVYGVYNVLPHLIGGGGTFYRQLRPLDVFSGTVQLDSGCNGILPFCITDYSPKGVVDNNGKLHVAFNVHGCSFGSCTDSVYQADNTLGQNMTAISLTTSVPPPLTAPDIAVAGDNSIFITYSYSNTTTDSVIYASGTSAASPFVTATVPLSGGSDPWRVVGNVHIASVNNKPAVAFAAKNIGPFNKSEVWFFSKGDSSVTRITNGSGEQNEPLIATMGTLVDGQVAVIGWRTWYQAFIVSCLGDGFEYDQANLTVRKVYNNSGGCFSTGQAMAANALWTSAVWIDDKPQDTRLVPWLGFNANTTMLPLLRR